MQSLLHEFALDWASIAMTGSIKLKQHLPSLFDGASDTSDKLSNALFPPCGAWKASLVFRAQL